MSGRPDQKPPWRHHYIPEFYLKPWGLSGGRFVEFSRPRKGSQEVKYRWVSPKQTGFVNRLYELEGLSGDEAQRIETRFMRAVDGEAALVHQRYLAGSSGPFSEKEASAWTYFILTLVLRNPEEIEAAKSIFTRDWTIVDPETEAHYQSLRQPTDPLAAEEYFKSTGPEIVRRAAVESMVNAMGAPLMGNHIIKMRWGYLDKPVGYPALLTSDRPVVQDNIFGPNGVLLLPISPSRVFYAVNTPEAERSLSFTSATQVLNHLNYNVTVHAHRYVYATTRKPHRFVADNMSKVPARVHAAQVRPFNPEKRKKTRQT